MSLNMGGMIDSVFQSVPAFRTVTGGSWVSGIWTPGDPVTTEYAVNIQPATDREIDFIRNGGERIVDIRRLHINEGNMELIDQTGTWSFLGQQWKSVKVDNRFWHNYCVVVVNRIDDQDGGPA